MQWELRWCRKTWVGEKMVPKHELPKSILLHAQRLKCGANVCKLEEDVGEKGCVWINWQSLGPQKKIPFASFLSHLLENTLVKFVFPYMLSAYHEGAKWNTISVKLPHYTILTLTYPMKKEMPFVHHVVKWWGWGYTIKDDKNFKWKDSRTSIVETHV